MPKVAKVVIGICIFNITYIYIYVYQNIDIVQLVIGKKQKNEPS